MQGSISCKVQCEGRFTNRRSCRKNNEFSVLPAISNSVKRSKTTWHPGYVFVFMTEIFDTLNCFYQNRIDSIKILAQVIAGYFKQLAFCIIQQIENIGGVFIGIADNFATDTDQFPLNKFLENYS